MGSHLSSMKHYRYRLNENGWRKYLPGEADQSRVRVSLEGQFLTMDWSRPFQNKQNCWTPHIRTYLFQEGTVDCQIFIPSTGEVIEDFTAIPKKAKLHYEKADLFVMSRHEIVEICKDLRIPYEKIKTQVLIKNILEKRSLNGNKI